MANEYYPQGSQTQRMPQHSQQYQQQQQYPPRQISLMQDDTSTGQWVFTLLLVCIPLVNIVLLFVWAFGSNTETSKSNWAKANLIWILIAIILVAALFAASMAMGIDVWGPIRTYFRI